LTTLVPSAHTGPELNALRDNFSSNHARRAPSVVAPTCQFFLTRPRRTRNASDWLRVAIPAIPAIPWSSCLPFQPPTSSERTPASRYVTGLCEATVASQPVSCSFGMKLLVRSANAKNRMKLEFTAAGLPVFSATAYGKP